MVIGRHSANIGEHDQTYGIIDIAHHENHVHESNFPITDQVHPISVNKVCNLSHKLEQAPDPHQYFDCVEPFKDSRRWPW